MKKIIHAILASLAITSAGCATAYYSTLEQFGIEKRDVLVDRVKDARTEQKQTQKVFTSALEEFRTLVAVDGGDLERQYDKMNTSFERAQKQAADVRTRIDAVEEVGNRLFKEWEAELKEYESPELRARSEQQLFGTRTQFDELTLTMNRAAEKMDPVLALYQDQVLFLKHNLNARAISSLEIERARIEERVSVLVDEMNEAIEEADRFIASMS